MWRNNVNESISVTSENCQAKNLEPYKVSKLLLVSLVSEIGEWGVKPRFLCGMNINLLSDCTFNWILLDTQGQ